MIIYSPPGMGKTTAIRSLTRLVGERDRISVVAVDERGEFDPSAFTNATVDIISGMSKAEGIEIAKRTLGAELIIADEIGDMAEAEALISVGRGGIPFVITAHAKSLDELLSEPAIAILKERGYFGTAIGLSRSSGRTLARVDKL
jgi:stage III sporulation protein AA